MLELFINYETLRLIWWVLLGTLLIGFSITDGFDLGVATLLPFVAHSDEERRVVINTVGPVWEGNQVWLILGAGAIFAAFPPVYAVAFSGLYLPMFLVLAALIFRPVSFKYRSKMALSTWRNTWDRLLFITGVIPLIGFGLVIGNVLLGLPFHFDGDMRLDYQGGILDLISPFPLLCALLSVFMCTRHGAVYLLLKTEDPIAKRARRFFYHTSWLFLVVFTLCGFFIFYKIEGFSILSPLETGAHSAPLNKEVERILGGWTANYTHYSWMLLAPFFAYIGVIFSMICVFFRWHFSAFIASGLSIFGTLSTVGVSLFPFLLPSSLNPNHSLTLWDASSSHLTLFVMLVATAVFLPIILSYTSFVYWVLAGKISVQDVQKNTKEFY